MPARQIFVNESGNKMGNAFQMFNTYSIGYHVKLYFTIKKTLQVGQISLI